MKFEKYMLFTYIEIYSDSVKACVGMINTKFRVKFPLERGKKKNDIREQYTEYFKSVCNVLHLYKKPKTSMEECND